MMPGGLSDPKPATPEIQHIADQVKDDFEKRANVHCTTFKAVEFSSQVVAGTMYFIKVQISDTQYANLKVFQSLPYENQGPVLVDFRIGKTRDDDLDYF